MYTRIVVPLDGSDLAERAVVTAEELARSLGASIHLVRVVDFPSSSFTFVYSAMVESEVLTAQVESEMALANAYLQEVTRSLEEHGLTVTTEVRHGIAVQELVDAMQPGDLFIIASHGRSGVARWFLGSVAEEITRRSSVPILLVRTATPGARRRDRQDATLTA